MPSARQVHSLAWKLIASSAKIRAPRIQLRTIRIRKVTQVARSAVECVMGGLRSSPYRQTISDLSLVGKCSFGSRFVREPRRSHLRAGLKVAPAPEALRHRLATRRIRQV